MIQKNKHGLSEVVSYVLLVIIAVSISVLLYTYLELRVPKERPQCPDGVSLAVQDVVCTLTPQKACVGTTQGEKGKINIVLSNNGKRSVAGVYLRIGAPERKVKELLNKESPFFGFLPETGSTNLPPGGVIKKNYSLALVNEISIGEQALEIEPMIGTPGNLALCEKATVTRRISCALPVIAGGAIPATIPGTYARPDDKEYGTAIITITPDPSIAEGIDYMEVSLCRSSGGSCSPYENSPQKVSCPDALGRYYLQWWRRLQAGDYEMRSVVVLYSGSRIPVTQGPRGPTTYSFSIFSCTGQCEYDEKGARVRRNSDGVILCSRDNICGGGQWRQWFCNELCYTGKSESDKQIFGLLIYGCQICTNQYSCGGSLTSVIGPFYGPC